MSTEENKAMVRRFMEESFGEGKPELVNDLLDPDFVRYDPYIEAGEVRGAQTVKENIVWFHNAIPDLSCTIEEQVAEGEKVVSRWTVRGTHQGEFFGVAGTGNRVEFTGIQIDRFDESGKIVEERAEFDLLGAMRQAHAEARRIIAGLVERIPAIEAPQEVPKASEAADEQQGRGVRPHSATGGAQEGVQRPWWRRVFGG